MRGNRLNPPILQVKMKRMSKSKNYFIIIYIFLIFMSLLPISIQLKTLSGISPNTSQTLKPDYYHSNWISNFTSFYLDGIERYGQYSNQSIGIIWNTINATDKMYEIDLWFEANITYVVNFTLIDVTMTFVNSTTVTIFLYNTTTPYYDARWFNITLPQNIISFNITKRGSYDDFGFIHFIRLIHLTVVMIVPPIDGTINISFSLPDKVLYLVLFGLILFVILGAIIKTEKKLMSTKKLYTIMPFALVSLIFENIASTIIIIICIVSVLIPLR